MEWLDVLELINQHKPVHDIDDYLNYVSKWPLMVHLISAAICLGLSAIYHLFFVYSHEACLFLVKLDYTGIVILFFGSTVPFIQYMFACNEVVCKFYMFIKFLDLRSNFTFIVGGSCLAVFTISMLPIFSKPSLKWLRGLSFIALGVAVAAPLFYLQVFGDPDLMMPGRWQ